MRKAIFLLTLVVSLVLVGAATDSDIREAVHVRSELGAEIRLLQLQNAVERAVITGEETVTALNETKDTSQEQGILADLQGLNASLASYGPGNMSPEDYVALKGVARNLTSSFKAAVQDALTPGDRARIKAAASPRIQDVMVDRGDRLQGLISSFNEQRYLEVARETGLNTSSSISNPRERLREQVRGLPPGQRDQVRTRVREARVRSQIDVQAEAERGSAARSVREQVEKNRPGKARIRGNQASPGGRAVEAYVDEQRETIQRRVSPQGSQPSNPEDENANRGRGQGRR